MLIVCTERLVESIEVSDVASTLPNRPRVLLINMDEKPLYHDHFKKLLEQCRDCHNIHVVDPYHPGHICPQIVVKLKEGVEWAPLFDYSYNSRGLPTDKFHDLFRTCGYCKRVFLANSIGQHYCFMAPVRWR